jgi:deazaflavin-dependent oxidoreductase (nitroreductase family)
LNDLPARSPRQQLRRIVHRLPLWLRRCGLSGYERLLGIEWIVLTTRGRLTGRPHAVMLDAIGRDVEHGGWYVQPADPGAGWVRNVRADPRVLVEAGGRRRDAVAVEVTGPEGAEVVLRFIREHPRYARLVVRLVGYTPSIDVPDDVLRARLRDVVVFALREANARRPSP